MGVIATAVKHLIAAGLSGDALVAAIEEMESNQVMTSDEVVLTKRQARNKRYYERLKASENRLDKTIKTVSDGGVLPPSPAPLSSPPTTPPIIPQTPSSIPKTKRASRLSSDWVLPAAWGRWALEQGLPEQIIRTEADKFKDYWLSKGGKDATKLDWEATWRNWIRNAAQRLPSRGPPVPDASPDGLHRDSQGRVAMSDFTGLLLDRMKEREDGRTIEADYQHGTGHGAEQAFQRSGAEDRESGFQDGRLHPRLPRPALPVLEADD